MGKRSRRESRDSRPRLRRTTPAHVSDSSRSIRFAPYKFTSWSTTYDAPSLPNLVTPPFTRPVEIRRVLEYRKRAQHALPSRASPHPTYVDVAPRTPQARPRKNSTQSAGRSVCERRSERREVLHALRITGGSGGQKTPVFTNESYVHCRKRRK